MKTETEILAQLRQDIAEYPGDTGELLSNIVAYCEEAIDELPPDPTDGARCDGCWEYESACKCGEGDDELDERMAEGVFDGNGEREFSPLDDMSSTYYQEPGAYDELNDDGYPIN